VDLITLLVAGIFVIFGLILMNIIVFIAIASTFTLLIWLPSTFYIINNLGRYLPLLKKKDCSCNTCQVGEYFWEKFRKILLANVVIGISLFVTLIFIFNTIPSVFLNYPDNPILQNTTMHIFNWDFPLTITQSNLSPSAVAFELTLFVIPIFLLSLRLLANPRRDSRFFIFKNISKEGEIAKIKFFKEQIISFYFSFIATTIAIFYLAICFTAVKYNVVAVLSVLLSFWPKMDELALIIFIIAEIASIIFLTWFGEKYLESHEPIDQS
jgi:hypothetical protein